jgi:hypothetical protein
VLVGVIWKENTEKNTDTARGCSHELAQIVTGAQHGLTDEQIQGYGNYGAYYIGKPTHYPSSNTASIRSF